jgi:hypothetical protein
LNSPEIEHGRKYIMAGIGLGGHCHKEIERQPSISINGDERGLEIKICR